MSSLLLSAHTSIGIGGPIDAIVTLSDCRQAADTYAELGSQAHIILGEGSNIIADDSGFRGTAIRITDTAFTIEPTAKGALINVGAGLSFDHLVEMMSQEGFAGLECMSGIPGSVGSAPIQNIGAYGTQLSDCLQSVTCFDCRSKKTVTLSAQECQFHYRKSRFNGNDRGRFWILRLTLLLTKKILCKLQYPDLRRYFNGDDQAPVQEVRTAVLAIRQQKGMLDPRHDTTCPQSVGSFFKNPVLSGEPAIAWQRRFASAPIYPLTDAIKIPAAWLIEQAGFVRGTTQGRVGISPTHSLCLINRGGATFQELMQLARRIQDAVHKQFEIPLEIEPDILGVNGWL